MFSRIRPGLDPDHIITVCETMETQIERSFSEIICLSGRDKAQPHDWSRTPESLCRRVSILLTLTPCPCCFHSVWNQPSCECMHPLLYVSPNISTLFQKALRIPSNADLFWKRAWPVILKSLHTENQAQTVDLHRPKLGGQCDKLCISLWFPSCR